jgi:hypothetical protein
MRRRDELVDQGAHQAANGHQNNDLRKQVVLRHRHWSHIVLMDPEEQS